MFFYFECQKCKRVSDVFPASETPKGLVPCSVCKPIGSVVKKLPIYSYVYHCKRCALSSGLCSISDYNTLKGNRPTCSKCKKSDEVFLIKPAIAAGDKTKLAKRKVSGRLSTPNVEALGAYTDLETATLEQVTRSRPGKKRSLSLSVGSRSELEKFAIDPTSPPAKLAKAESEFQSNRRFRNDYDNKYGELTPQQDPLQTELHEGKVVTFSTYKAKLSESQKVAGTKYPKMNKSAPLVVNSAKLIDRATTWDYRDLGPNSLLRRLCSLIYVINYGKSDTQNPVEVQAMWAGGSLFLSTNNITFSEQLLADLVKYGSVCKLIKEIKLTDTATGALDAKMRNFGTEHTARLPRYQKEIADNNYASYFRYKWSYAFDALRNALALAPPHIERIVVANDDQGYKYWRVEKVPVAGKVYIVLPKKKAKGSDDTHFIKKKIHAEQMFYPIMMQFNQAAKLSSIDPAFVGGVKTPCRTCALVLDAAAIELRDKLILPTNAFGHYWEASGMHVPKPVFKPTDETLVFGSKKAIGDDSINIYNTEMPPSPKR